MALQSARANVPRSANTRSGYIAPQKQTPILRTILVGYRNRTIVVKR